MLTFRIFGDRVVRARAVVLRVFDLLPSLSLEACTGCYFVCPFAFSFFVCSAKTRCLIECISEIDWEVVGLKYLSTLHDLHAVASLELLVRGC